MKRFRKGGQRPSRILPGGQGRKKYAAKAGNDCSDHADSDVDSDDFYHDEIDDFHADREKVLWGDEIPKANAYSREEEVLPLTDDDDDDDLDENIEDEEAEDAEEQHSVHKSEMESDLEDKSDDDLPNLDAWGKKKSMYYNADFVDMDWGKSYNEKDKEQAEAEERAARENEERRLQELSGSVYMEEIEQLKRDHEANPTDEKDFSSAARDLTSLSKKEKLAMFKRESPEFFVLVNEFRAAMTELIERISPLIPLVEDGRIKGSGAKYLTLKQGLILQYTMNISFYMMLKSQKETAKHAKYHPVMDRISEFKKIMDRFKPHDEKLKFEMDFMLEKLKNGEDIEFLDESPGELEENAPVDKYASLKLPTQKRLHEKQTPAIGNPSKKQKVNALFETETEKEVASLYMDMKQKQRNDQLLQSSDENEAEQEEEENDFNLEEEELEGSDEAANEKRTITYEIAKNKGLLPYRNKEYRNPRVRNRMKYRRAKIRRKGQVREPRKELTRYGGELTGIRTDVKKSITLK